MLRRLLRPDDDRIVCGPADEAAAAGYILHTTDLSFAADNLHRVRQFAESLNGRFCILPANDASAAILDRALSQEVIYLNADAHGFGDATYTAWIAHGSRNAPITLINRATGARKSYLEMLGQYVADVPPSVCKDTFEAYFTFECDLERGAVPRVISRGRALGITKSLPERPGPISIPQKARDWAAEVAKQRRISRRKKFVALWPQTVWPSREWPPGYWLDLAWKLHMEHGIGACFFLETRDERFKNSPSWINGMPWENWAAIMLEADLNVCISSGPACLAGTLDVPTIVLEGPTKSTIWAHNPSIEVMRAGKQVMACDGCHFGRPFRAACDPGCMAMMRVFPDQVVARIVAKLQEIEDDPANGKYSGRTPVTVFDPARRTGGAGYEGHHGGLAGRLLPRGRSADSGGR